MKKLLFIISILLAVMGLYSQNLVVEGEYFWDTDPGNGNGIPISATDGSFDSAVENLFLNGIDVSTLSIGAHVFNVRVKGADGTWSSTFKQIVCKEGALTTITRDVKVNQAEYFWDSDPGNGSATPLLVFDGTYDSAIEQVLQNNVDITSLALGSHTFNVRIKGEDGTWSSIFKTVVYLEGPQVEISRTVKVNQAECFWDADPGNGSATPLIVFDGTFDSAIEQVFKNNVDISSMPLGAHTFNVRIKGEDGNWSSIFKTVVYLEGTQVEISRTVKVNQAEYFWDADPGNGSATPLIVFDGTFDSAIEQVFKNNVDISSLPLGAHTFNVRIKGEDGSWSSIFKTVVYLEGPQVAISRTVKVNQTEYFWDADPGNGNATPLLVFDGLFDNTIEQLFKDNLDISTLSQGAHSFNVRILGEDGTWSETFRTVVYLAGLQTTISRTINVVQGEYFWDSDPGVGFATPLLALDGSFDNSLENLFKNGISTTALSIGPHSFNVRVKGQDGTWSELFRQAIYVSCGSPIPPSITISLYSSGLCEGTETIFQAVAINGGTTPVYTWYVNGTPAGTNSPFFSSSSLNNGDVITCELLSNSSCASPNNATSNSITVSLSPVTAPTISISSSEGSSICTGTSVTFTALATNAGSSPFYQWKIDGVNAGINSSTFITSSLSNGDVVSCVLTSSDGCATPPTVNSNNINMEVLNIVTPSVSISGNIGPTICDGSSVTFTATPVNGGSTPTYIWTINGSSVGINNPNYTAAGLNDGDVINCEIISSRSCLTTPNATSNSITITVLPVVTASVSISSGGVTTICSGTPVTFTASAINGGTTPDYEWVINGFSQGVNNSTFNTSSLSNGDVVYCYMTSSFTCSTPSTASSNSITMTVNSSALPVATIGSDVGTVICDGTTVNFSASVTNGGSSPDYEWKLNGSTIGLNSPNYSSSSLNDGDEIYCIITSNASCVNGISDVSNLITMSVLSPVTPTISISSDQGTTICSGTYLTFTANTENEGASPDYQWYVNGSPVGFNSSAFSTSSLDDGDQVTCNLTSSLSCVTTSSASANTIIMDVIPSYSASVSISTGDPTEICEGTEISFAANPVNEGPSPVYQWYINGFPVGSNSATISYSSFSDGDEVSVSMTGSLTCTSPLVSYSNEITITVHPTYNPTLTIFADPGSSVCEGSGVIFTAFPTNGGSLPEYEWFLNGISTGDNSSTLDLASVNDGDEIYCILTSNGFCVNGVTATSNTIELTSVTVDNSVTVSSNVITANQTGASYQWFNCEGMIEIFGETSQSFTAVVTGNYAVEVTIGNCTVLSDCSYIVVVGIEETEAGWIKVYPNPAISVVKIEANETITSPVRIYDVAGKLVSENYLDDSGLLYISSLSPGTYIIELQVSDVTYRQRIVKTD